jgi:DNA repair protein RecN (Recombination protein N)
MLRTQLCALHAVGLGPIDDARLEFSTGLNVLTGETGAGKTLLIGALTLCLGESDGRALRTAGDLRAAALFVDGAEEVAFARESVAGGRLKGTLDGLTTSAEVLRSRASELIVIHGQHDSLRLRQRSEVVKLVDQFAGIDDTALRDIRAHINHLLTQRDQYGGDSTQRQREIEFLRFQLSDIEQVAPTSVEELSEVLDQLSQLSTLRDHFDEIAAAIELLDGDSDESVLSQWARSVQHLPDGSQIDATKQALLAISRDARDLVSDLRQQIDGVDLDAETMQALELRAGSLQNLARKFGGSLSDVFAQWADIAKSLEVHENATELLATVDTELLSLRSEESRLASELLDLRLHAARNFCDAVQANFERVALQAATLNLAVSGDDGSQMEMLFCPNPGRASGPLQSLASGGELSRVLLAISLVTVSDGVVAVFDEIDAGVGGSVAEQIGECLFELSLRQQVIVVTHLASIAARADRHFVVQKQTDLLGTSTTVSEISGEQRVDEIARMLAGSSQMRESRELARRLLERA